MIETVALAVLTGIAGWLFFHQRLAFLQDDPSIGIPQDPFANMRYWGSY